MTMARIMRPGDRAECESVGVSAKRALWRSYKGSLEAWAVEVEGEGLAAVFGLGGVILSDVGIPWLMTGPLVEKYPFAFLRVSKAIVAGFLEQKPRLENYVLADYRGACRLLEAIGFTLGDPEPHGVQRVMFRKFTMER